MSVTSENPRAFPSDYVTERGMTLRDWLAGKAMVAYITRNSGPFSDPHSIASCAYDVADAMLHERAKEGER